MIKKLKGCKQAEFILSFEPKLYFFDTGLIKADKGVKLENTVAVCLHKYSEYQRDAKGKDICLHYMKTKEGKEVDFAIIVEDELKQIIEVKLSDSKLSKSLLFFSKQFPGAEAIQLIHNLRHEQYLNRINLIPAGECLLRL